MRKFILYWALYGLIELIMYVWLFQVIGFWPLLFIQAASSAFGVFIFQTAWWQPFPKFTRWPHCSPVFVG